MKNGSKFLRLALVGVLGAAVMIGCSDDTPYAEESSEYDENGCRRVLDEEIGDYKEICDGSTTVAPGDDSVPEEETTTTVEETTTTVEETTTTTAPRPTTTVKKTTAATAPPTTQAPTTAPPTTQAPTTAPPTTLPPVNVTFMWSGSDSGCNTPFNTLDLMVDVMGATSSGTIIVTVNGQPVNSNGGSSFAVGDTMYILFDQWPTLPNGTYPVTITASSSTQGPTTVTTSVTYNCPV
jgi:cytoskeletal protein RodZ